MVRQGRRSDEFHKASRTPELDSLLIRMHVPLESFPEPQSAAAHTESDSGGSGTVPHMRAAGKAAPNAMTDKRSRVVQTIMKKPSCGHSLPARGRQLPCIPEGLMDQSVSQQAARGCANMAPDSSSGAGQLAVALEQAGQLARDERLVVLKKPSGRTGRSGRQAKEDNPRTRRSVEDCELPYATAKSFRAAMRTWASEMVF